APSAVARLVDLGVQSFLVASSVRTIVAQRLVRRLCSFCKRPGPPTEVERRALHLESSQPTESQIMQPLGCDQCRHTGYAGRIGIFEILSIDDDLCRAISHFCSTSFL